MIQFLCTVGCFLTCFHLPQVLGLQSQVFHAGSAGSVSADFFEDAPQKRANEAPFDVGADAVPEPPEPPEPPELDPSASETQAPAPNETPPVAPMTPVALVSEAKAVHNEKAKAEETALQEEEAQLAKQRQRSRAGRGAGLRAGAKAAAVRVWEQPPRQAPEPEAWSAGGTAPAEAAQTLATKHLAQKAHHHHPAVSEKKAALQSRLMRLHEEERQLREMEMSLKGLDRGLETSATPEVSPLSASPNATEYGPDHDSCTPKCLYSCTTPRCEAECSPECSQPKCQTRCASADLSQCKMNCGKQHCSVVCPKEPCVEGDCQPCRTHCTEPVCMLQCPRAQPCHNVCEEPQCTWKCKAPEACPKPDCKLSCETSRSCVGSTYAKMPPLDDGEVAVTSFAAPELLLQGDSEARQARPTMKLSVPVHTGRALVRRSSASDWPYGSHQWNVQLPVS